MNKSLIATFLCIAIFSCLAVFVWPTRYRYDHMKIGENDLPVRTDRLGGKGEFLLPNGWHALGKTAEAQKTTTEQGLPTKPWNTSALVVTGPPSFDVSKDGKSLEWDYWVKNNTNVDYNLDDYTANKLRVMTKFRDGSLAPLNNWVTFLDTPIFMPAGEIVGLNLSVKLPNVPTPKGGEVKAKYDERVRTYLETEVPRVSGFVLYDEVNRYQIDLPWAEERAGN